MNSPSGHNPYQPPNADVTPTNNASSGEFIDGGQSVLAGHAVGWIGTGWQLFIKSPGIWIVNIIIMFVLSTVLSAIPVIGSFASSLLTPVLIGGIMLGCRALDRGESLEVAHLFAGFKEKIGPLMLVGLLMVAIAIGIAILVLGAVIVMFGTAILQSIGDPEAVAAFFVEQGLMLLLLFVLLFFALLIPLIMAYWFAPALVVFQDMDAVTAMRHSFVGCLRNFLPFLLYGLLFLVLGIIAIIPIGLGLLVLFPMAYGSMYGSYKDIYLRS